MLTPRATRLLQFIITTERVTSIVLQGANSWQYNAGGSCSDTQATQKAGMLALKGLNGAGGLVNFPVV